MRRVLLILLLVGSALAINIEECVFPDSTPHPEQTVYLWCNVSHAEPISYSFKVDNEVVGSGTEACSGCNSILNITHRVPPNLNDTNFWEISLSNSSETLKRSGNYTTEGLELSVSQIPISTIGKFTVQGQLNYTDDTPAKDSLVEITTDGLCPFTKVYTDSVGKYTMTCDFSDHTLTGSYDVGVSGYYSINEYVSAQAQVSIKGLTRTNLTLEVTKGETKTKLVSKWRVIEGSEIEWVNMTTRFDGKEYTKECTSLTDVYYSNCTLTVNAPTPKLSGSYLINATAVWEDRQGSIRKTNVSKWLVIAEQVEVDILPISGLVPLGDTKVPFFVNASRSNINVVLDLKEETYFSMHTLEMDANTNTTHNITVSLPYDYRETSIAKTLYLVDQNDKEYAFPMELSVNQPELYWLPVSVWKFTGENTSLHIPVRLSNNGSTAKQVSLSIACPDYWVCTMSPKTFQEFTGEEIINVSLSPTLVEQSALASVFVTATDKAGRKVSQEIKVDLKLQPAVEVSGTYVTDTITPGIDYSRFVFFISGDKIEPRETPENTDAIIARSKRLSTLTPWLVSLSPTSEGIDEVCEVWVRVGNTNYKLNKNPEDKLPLQSKIGDAAFVYLKFLKPGVCKPVVLFNNQTTEAYVVLEQKQAGTTGEDTGELLKAVEERVIAANNEANLPITILVIGSVIVVAVWLFNSYYGKPPTTPMPRQPVKPIFVRDTSKPNNIQSRIPRYPPPNPGPNTRFGRYFHRKGDD